jgi:hypothetical protein
MRALAVLLAAGASGVGAAAVAQALGSELLRGGALFNVKMVSQCAASAGASGALVQMVLVDDATAAMVPADPQVNAADSAAAAKAKADGKRGLDTLKVMQFACAGDIRKVCSIGDPAKMTCPERVFAACPQCFPQNIMIDKKCLCTCEQKPELNSCFMPKPKPTPKPTSKPSAAAAVGRLLRARSLEEELIELAQLRALGEEDSMGESMGKMDFKNKTARAQLAGAMRSVKTCFENKAAQLSPACRASMTVLDNRNKKHNTTRPKPPVACCQTPKPTLPKQSMTRKPTMAGMTRKPTVAGATRKPTVAGMTPKPTVAGATRKPTVAGMTPKPTVAGMTAKPTVAGKAAESGADAAANAEVDPEGSAYGDTSAYGDADELMAGVDMATAQGEDLMSEPIDGTTAATLSDPVADAAWAIETAEIDNADVSDAAPSSANPPAPSSSPMPAGAAVGLFAGAVALVAALLVGGKAAARLKADRAAHEAKPELAVAAPKDQDAQDEPAEPASSTGGSSAVDVESSSAASAPSDSSGAEKQQSRKERKKERKLRQDTAKTTSTDEPAVDPEADL